MNRKQKHKLVQEIKKAYSDIYEKPVDSEADKDRVKFLKDVMQTHSDITLRRDLPDKIKKLEGKKRSGQRQIYWESVQKFILALSDRENSETIIADASKIFDAYSKVYFRNQANTLFQVLRRREGRLRYEEEKIFFIEKLQNGDREIIEKQRTSLRRTNRREKYEIEESLETFVIESGCTYFKAQPEPELFLSATPAKDLFPTEYREFSRVLEKYLNGLQRKKGELYLSDLWRKLLELNKARAFMAPYDLDQIVLETAYKSDLMSSDVAEEYGISTDQQ